LAIDAPNVIDNCCVLEYGYFPLPLLPLGYVPLPGSPSLAPILGVAISQSDREDGYYVLFCTPEWQRVTFGYCETLAAAKLLPSEEFGQDISLWQEPPNNGCT
jgi:hypothetical protein